MWGEVIKVCKDIMQHYFNDKKEKKDKLSKLFLAISDIIMEICNKLEQDEYPHYHCAIMDTLSQELIMFSTGVLDNEKSIKFTDSLFECSKLEGEFAGRKDSVTIPKLRSIAGEFKGLSMLLES